MVALTHILAFHPPPPLPAGGLRLMTPVRTQGVCGACVAFTTLAAAEAAVAKSLRISSSNTMDFSEQALFFCGDMTGSCAEGWDLLSGGQVLQRRGITWEACLPYRGAYGCSVGGRAVHWAGGGLVGRAGHWAGGAAGSLPRGVVSLPWMWYVY